MNDMSDDNMRMDGNSSLVRVNSAASFLKASPSQLQDFLQTKKVGGVENDHAS